MGIHINVWDGSRSARITDMTNAGKIGKVCRVLRFNGYPCGYGVPGGSEAAYNVTNQAIGEIKELAPSDTFEHAADLLAKLTADARAAGVSEGWFGVYEDTIKGIKAPREVLTAGVEGQWSASADVSGVSLMKLDDVNEWREITPSSQTGPRAYALAAKVWPAVRQAQTMRQASDILSAAGVKLHGYCGMD